MLVEFGKASYIGKIRQQPEKVKMVMEKIVDGITPTLSAVRSKLNQPIPLGYSNVGEVEEVSVALKNLMLVTVLSQTVLTLK